MRVALIGYGNMGKAIDQIAPSLGLEVVARIHRTAEDVANREITEKSLRNAQVAIECTHPKAVVENIKKLINLKCDIVVGTTGWYQQFSFVQSLVEKENIGFFYAENFSVGMFIFRELCKQVARECREYEEVGFSLLESHHCAKVDSPSGTAKAIQSDMRSILECELPISSMRVGSQPGKHQLTVDFPYEEMVIEHNVRDRTTFAQGACNAAKWVCGRKGVFSIKEMLEGNRDDQRCIYSTDYSIH